MFAFPFVSILVSVVSSPSAVSVVGASTSNVAVTVFSSPEFSLKYGIAFSYTNTDTCHVIKFCMLSAHQMI